ncbi:MAG: hypothetical protein ABIN15_08005, partial [candidate division WOR-3 bacterium]
MNKGKEALRRKLKKLDKTKRCNGNFYAVVSKLTLNDFPYLKKYSINLKKNLCYNKYNERFKSFKVLGKKGAKMKKMVAMLLAIIGFYALEGNQFSIPEELLKSWTNDYIGFEKNLGQIQNFEGEFA